MSSSSFDFYSLIMQLTRLPVFVLLIVGLVLAISRQARHPRASMLAAGAMVAGLVQMIAGFGFQMWMTQRAAGGGYDEVKMFYAGFNVLNMVLELAAWGLALAAIFAGRAPAAAARP